MGEPRRSGGVIVPRISSVEDAGFAIEAAKGGGTDDVMVLALVKTLEGVDNAEAILKAGVDGLGVWSADLSFAFGDPSVRMSRAEPRMKDARARVLAACVQHSKPYWS